ncbi:MAG: CHAT domain-containing protein [Anaerolineae bacterium]|jgi:CHAT domain-containing protein
MHPQDLIEQLVAEPDAAVQQRILQEHAPNLDDQVAEALKEKVIQLQQADVQCALRIAGLILYMAELTAKPLHRALGLRAEAQVRAISLGEYQHSLELYDQATEICQACNDLLNQAKIQVTRVWPLACLGHHDKAFEAGQWARKILTEHGQWRSLASLTMNLAFIHLRSGENVKALEMLDKAQDAFTRLGPEGEPFWALSELNRAIVLRDLGRFEASIQASQRACKVMIRLGHKVEAAKAQQNLAAVYFVLGRYNEALRILDQAQTVFLADGRQRDAILVELYVLECLLQLRRFADVLEKCRRVRSLFTRLGVRFEVSQAILYEAVAYAGLRHYDKALASLDEAHGFFKEEDNNVWMAYADLEKAVILHHQGRHEESLVIAASNAQVFRVHNLPVKQAQACLIAARAAIALNRNGQARRLAAKALSIGKSRNIPTLTYQSHHLLGILAEAQENLQDALTEYDQAIAELEQLQGRLMVEFRADFLEDKQVVYENIVGLHLALDQPRQGLEYAERAKSRALLDLLAYRLDLSIRAKETTDRPLVEKLTHLRAERDRLYHHWECASDLKGGDWPSSDEGRRQTQQQVLALEKRITGLWHKLLIRNADYARDAALWHVRTEPIQPYLAPETLLVEYFIARDALAVFLVTADKVEAQRLLVDLPRVRNLAQLLWLNLKAVPKRNLHHVTRSSGNVRSLLRQLYELLIAPLDDVLTAYRQLIIVPHGPLHYLPFHALHDGKSFLLERHEISYLPGASLLRYCCETQPAASGLLACGHSYNGRLPYTVDEARSIAALFDGEALLEDKATPARLRQVVSDKRVVHLATHGNFRPDDPLFSGLTLDGGWLTTLDIFNLRLDASLVTLSACQTGRSVVGGGDELLGLMRAFIYAGAASLVLSLWAVEDRSTAQLMEGFYRGLVQGQTKGSALRLAQLQFVQGQGASDGAMAEIYTHPYFWAPFFLVGDAGAL